MDHKTRELRRRNKALQGRRGELPEFEARGLGRKLKPAETFSLKRCDHIDGGKVIWVPVKKVNVLPGDKKIGFIKIVKGGVRCPSTAVSGSQCLDHKRTRGDDE